MSLTTTFYSEEVITVIGRKHITQLKEAASKDALKRARICLHQQPEADIHEMIIAICERSYSRPHRNVRNSKSYLVIEGKIVIAVFDDSGNILQKIVLVASDEDGSFFCRMNENCWHTVVALSPQAVFMETNGGPFIKSSEQYAQWSPDYDDNEKIAEFVSTIMKN